MEQPPKNTVIQPTIGRQVHYWPRKGEPLNVVMDQPLAATVVCVFDDRRVNLQIIDHTGNAYERLSVPLVQPGDPVPKEGHFCQWMSFQVGQGPSSHDVIRRLEALEQGPGYGDIIADLEKRVEEVERLQRAPTDVAVDPEYHDRNAGGKKGGPDETVDRLTDRPGTAG